MSFNKVGSPQPMQVMSETCEECGKNKAQFFVAGRSVCSECKAKLEGSEQS
jgi:ribosomal protein L37AE/L43A